MTRRNQQQYPSQLVLAGMGRRAHEKKLSFVQWHLVECGSWLHAGQPHKAEAGRGDNIRYHEDNIMVLCLRPGTPGGCTEIINHFGGEGLSTASWCAQQGNGFYKTRAVLP